MIWVGVLLGSLVRTPEGVQGIGFGVLFPLTFLASTFVPVETMPDVLQRVTVWNPVTTLADALRVQFGNPSASPAAGDAWSVVHPAAYTLIWIVGIVAVCAAAGRPRLPALDRDVRRSSERKGARHVGHPSARLRRPRRAGCSSRSPTPSPPTGRRASGRVSRSPPRRHVDQAGRARALSESPDLPMTPGREVAGVIDAVGAQVDQGVGRATRRGAPRPRCPAATPSWP